MLAEEKRQQLDSIVQQMVQNQESDDTVQFVVNDFKNRHSVDEPQKSFLEKTTDYFDMFFGSGKVGEAIGTQIAKARAKPEEKEFISPGPSAREIAGSVLQSAALFAPVGTAAKGIATGVRALGLVKGAPAIGKIAAGALTGEMFDIASNLQQGKSGKEALTPGIGTLIGGAIPTLGVAKNVSVRFGHRQAPRIINSLIKPLAKDFSYGKNPGRAVAEEGIVANTFDDLIERIREARFNVGRQFGEIVQKLSPKPIIELTPSLKYIDDAIKVAAKQNNASLMHRLSSVKRAITEVLEPSIDEAGDIGIKSVGSRNLDSLTFQQVRTILSDIGDMTQFTGNFSDDKLVNSALKKTYGKIKEISLKYAESVNPTLAREFSKLTEKYADLHSAEIAARYRDKIVERHDLIGFSPRNIGIASGLITAVATGGATVPALVVGMSATVIDKLAQTPGFKTRLAYMLSKKTIQETNFLFKKIPALSRFFSTETGIFPGDIILGEKGEVIAKRIGEVISKPKIGLSIEAVDYPLTTKFLEYAKDKTTLSRQEIMDFARRPELKKGEADLLNAKIKEFSDAKIPAQEFADSIRRDLLELKPVKVKEPQYDSTTISRYNERELYPKATSEKGLGKNYEEVVFESPIVTNGSSHYPNSKNYFAHTRGDEVVESGKKIWREQEIQSDLLQKEGLERMPIHKFRDKTFQESYNDFIKQGKNPDEALELAQREIVDPRQSEIDKLQPFTNDRFGERIMRERIKEKAQKGYEKYRLPTGETIGKIEGFGNDRGYWRIVEDNPNYSARENFRFLAKDDLTPENLKVGMQVNNRGDESTSWIITDILGDGRFKAVSKVVWDGVKNKLPQYTKDSLIDLAEIHDLTGKSNPQYRRYSDWGKFLKNKYGGKEITDPQGNNWIEIDLKPEYKRMPVEAFGKTNIESLIGLAGASLGGSIVGIHSIYKLYGLPTGWIANLSEEVKNEFPFTEEAKNQLSDVSFKQTEYSDSVGGDYTDKNEEISAVLKVFSFSDKTINRVINLLSMQDFDKPTIRLEKDLQQPIHKELAHEMLHHLYRQKDEIFHRDWYDTWNNLADKNNRLLDIDRRMGRSGYDMQDAVSLASERFSFLGQEAIDGGIEVIPLELRRFYENIIRQ